MSTFHLSSFRNISRSRVSQLIHLSYLSQFVSNLTKSGPTERLDWPNQIRSISSSQTSAPQFSQSKFNSTQIPPLKCQLSSKLLRALMVMRISANSTECLRRTSSTYVGLVPQIAHNRVTLNSYMLVYLRRSELTQPGPEVWMLLNSTQRALLKG
jgi:hypothetical protein